MIRLYAILERQPQHIRRLSAIIHAVYELQVEMLLGNIRPADEAFVIVHSAACSRPKLQYPLYDCICDPVEIAVPRPGFEGSEFYIAD